jgi:hypothetical protein
MLVPGSSFCDVYTKELLVHIIPYRSPFLIAFPPHPTLPSLGGVKTKTGADGRGEWKVSCDYYPKIGGTTDRIPLNSANLSIRIATHTERNHKNNPIESQCLNFYHSGIP